MEDRRKSPRVDLNLPAHWESATGIHEGRIINCSEGGCFVQAEVEEPGNEPMKLAIELPEGKVQLWGRVAYYLPTMGFGLHFTSGQSTLKGWLDYLQANTPIGS
jgi:PilZ domain-containing protein